MLDRTGSGVAGIGKSGQSLLVAGGVQRSKNRFRQINLATDFDLGRSLALQAVRDIGNRQDVLGHIIAGDAISARGGADESAVFVKQRDRHAINLRLDGEVDRPAFGELSDAASALDWVQSIHPEAQTTWIAGYSFGALIGMQLLMRRPEIRGFISIAPPANMYDFSFLAPCPSSGIIIQGTGDEVVTPSAVQKLVDKLRTQKHITIHHDEINGANHFFEAEMPQLMGSVDKYLDMRLDPNSPIR